MKKRRLLYLLPMMAMVFAGCEKKNKNTEPEQQQPSGEGEGGGQQESKKDFEGLTFPSAVATYDGQPHEITISGDLPEGATVSYGESGNSFTAVGEYEVTATISGEGYNDLVLHATLEIIKADFAGLTFTDATVAYNGQAHSIEISGDLPEGAEVSYGEGGNSFTAVGEYEVTATITCAGYNDLELKATLTITKGTMTGITFANQEVAFDGNPHEITPEIPAEYVGATVSYDENGNSFTGSGLHVVNATISCEGYEDVELSATLTIGTGPVATESLKVFDFEGLTDNDLADELDLKFYRDGEGWVTPQAFKVNIEKNQVFAGGTNTMKMTMTHQGSAFKATTNLQNKTYNKYSAFTIDTMMDSRVEEGTMKVQVQFWLKDLPLPEAYAGYRTTYVTYTLSDNAPSIWTHWEIPFDDPSISIASGAIPASALSAMGMTAEDLTSYIDQVAILITPNYKNGGNCYAYVDNIALTRGTAKVEQRHIYGGKYVNITGENAYKFNLANDLQTGSFEINNDVISQLTVEKGDKAVIAKDAEHAGAGLTVTANIESDGSLTVASVSGAAAATYASLEGMSFARHANVNIDFTGVTPGAALQDSHWYQEKWDQSWQQISGQMNVRNSGDNIFCNMVTGYYMDYRYTYTYPEQFGLADKFSIDLGNDFGGAADIKLKIKLVNAQGGETFVIGSSDAYEVIPAGTAKFQHFENNDFGEVNVKAIVVTVKSTTGASQYLYFDNLKLSHSVPEVIPSYSVDNGKYFVYNSSTEAFTLDLNNDSAIISKLGAGAFSFNVVTNGLNMTFTDDGFGGSQFVMEAEITGDNEIKVTSCSGSYGEAFSASLVGKTFRPNAFANLDFADGTTDQYYQESHWKESKYTNTGWTEYAAPQNMRSKLYGGNKIVNMYASTSAINFRYSPDLPFGPVNHVSVDLGNYWSSASGAIRYKISILDPNGTVAKYVAGDASNWATIEKDAIAQLHTLEFYFDMIKGYALRITTSMASGQAYLYMDNLIVDYKTKPVAPSYSLEDGEYYIWNGSSDAFRLSLSNSQTQATVTKCGGDSYEMTAEVNETTVTLKDAANAGAGLTIIATLTADNTMQVTSVTGAAASLISASLLNKTVKHCANVSLDFSDGTVGNKYSNSHWTAQKYTTKWEDCTPDMNSRQDASSNKVVNLVCGGYTTNFIYTPDLSMGPVNHVSFDMANYFGSSAGDIQVKVCVIDGGGTKYYALGSTDDFVTITKDTSNGSVLVHYDKSINLCAGAKLQITTKCSAGTSYLYVDNFQVSYQA